MTIKDMHFEMELVLNVIGSDHYKKMQPIQKDVYLNKAQTWYIESFGFNKIRGGFDFSQQNKDMFSTLLIKDEPLITPTLIKSNQYLVKLDGLSKPYVHLTRSEAYCNNTPIKIGLVKSDDYAHVMSPSSLQKPSKLWKTAVGTLGYYDNSVSLVIDTDGEIDSVYVEYIKKPRDVFFGGYDTPSRYFDPANTSFYGTADDPVDSEISEHYHHLLVDIACYLISGSTNNQFLLQVLDKRINEQ